MSKHFRLARLIEIIHIVNSDRSWNVRKLAEYFEVSEKRIYDDIKELHAAQIPIVFDEKLGGYTLLKRPNIPTGMILEGMGRR